MMTIVIMIILIKMRMIMRTIMMTMMTGCWHTSTTLPSIMLNTGDLYQRIVMF